MALAWSAVVIGLASLAANYFGISLGVASTALQYGSDVWYAVVGIMFIGKGRAASTTIEI